MKKIISGVVLFSPVLAFAQNLGNFKTALVSLGGLVQIALPIVFGIALLAFFWGLAKYILAAGDEEKKAEGKRLMIWGVLALFIMASIWGIIALLQSNFGVSPNGATPTLPNIPGL